MSSIIPPSKISMVLRIHGNTKGCICAALMQLLEVESGGSGEGTKILLEVESGGSGDGTKILRPSTLMSKNSDSRDSDEAAEQLEETPTKKTKTAEQMENTRAKRRRRKGNLHAAKTARRLDQLNLHARGDPPPKPCHLCRGSHWSWDCPRYPAWARKMGPKLDIEHVNASGNEPLLVVVAPHMAKVDVPEAEQMSGSDSETHMGLMAPDVVMKDIEFQM